MVSNIDRIRIFAVIALGASLGLAAPACGAITLDHCWWQDGDNTCRAIFKDKPFCSTDANHCDVVAPYGCVEFEPKAACHSPCGRKSREENPDCKATTSDTGTTETGMDVGDVEGDMVPQIHDVFDNQAGD